MNSLTKCAIASVVCAVAQFSLIFMVPLNRHLKEFLVCLVMVMSFHILISVRRIRRREILERWRLTIGGHDGQS